MVWTTYFFFIQYTSNIYIDNHNEQKQTVRSQCLDLNKKLNSNFELLTLTTFSMTYGVI